MFSEMWYCVAVLVFPDVSKERGAFETSGKTNAATQSHIPEDLNYQQNSCLNLVLCSSNVCSHIAIFHSVMEFRFSTACL